MTENALDLSRQLVDVEREHDRAVEIVLVEKIEVGIAVEIEAVNVVDAVLARQGMIAVDALRHEGMIDAEIKVMIMVEEVGPQIEDPHELTDLPRVSEESAFHGA